MRPLRIALVVVACIAAPSVAAAQIDDAARAQAEAYMRVGVTAARGGHWEEAYAAFHQAYEYAPTNHVLMNLAGAERQTSRWAEAVRSYRLWLVNATAADEPARAGMEQALAEAEQNLAHVTIEADGARTADVVTVDDDPAERGVPLELDPGRHVVHLVRGDTVLRETTLELTAGESRTVSLPPGPSEVAAAAPEVTPWRPRPREHHADLTANPWLWVGVGAGVVVIGLVILAAVLASQSAPVPDVGNIGTFTL